MYSSEGLISNLLLYIGNERPISVSANAQCTITHPAGGGRTDVTIYSGNTCETKRFSCRIYQASLAITVVREFVVHMLALCCGSTATNRLIKSSINASNLWSLMVCIFKTSLKRTRQLETVKKVLIISFGSYFPEDDQFKIFKVAASLRQIDSLSLGAFPIAHFHNFVTRIYFWSVPIFFRRERP